MLRKLEIAEYPLAKQFYKYTGYGGAPGRNEACYVWMQDGRVVGAVRIEAYGEQRFLRGFVIDPKLRGQGLGSQFLATLLTRSNEANYWCFPFSHLETFYQRAGFYLVDPQDSPDWYKSKFSRLSQQRNIVCMSWHRKR